MANNTVRHINIIGHQNPDTDSICSALAYAWLKNRGSLNGLYEARRAGHVNRETRFVLQHFGIEAPRLCTDVSPQIKDIDIRKQAGIDGEMSLRAAWNLMRDVEIDTLCIVDGDNELQGLITIKDIADANMDLFDTAVLAAANTRCTNLLETLEAELVVGSADAHIDSGNICIGTSPEIMEELVKPGDLVLVSNRYETQMCAIDCGAQLIVSHHPVMNVRWHEREMQTLRPDTRLGGVLTALVKNDISAICMHTNLDAADGGVNDCLAKKLGLNDVFLLNDEKIGRIGTLSCEKGLEEFLRDVIELLGCGGLRYCRGSGRVHRVAVGGGACGEYIPQAIAQGCDTFVTSDLRYNDFLDTRGLNLIDAGHFPTENVVCPTVKAYLEEHFPEVKTVISTSHRDVIQYYL